MDQWHTLKRDGQIITGIFVVVFKKASFILCSSRLGTGLAQCITISLYSQGNTKN